MGFKETRVYALQNSVLDAKCPGVFSPNSYKYFTDNVHEHFDFSTVGECMIRYNSHQPAEMR